MLISLCLLITLAVIFLGYICPKVGVLNLLIGVILFLASIFSFLATSLLNPGIVIGPLQAKIKADFNASFDKICSDCNVIQEENTEHCKKCKVCIEGHDDHYMLLGKCVGSGTLKYFYAFLLLSLVMLIFTVSSLFLRFKNKL